MPRPIDARGLAFHRLVLARRRTGWWTPLVVGLLGAAFYAGLLFGVFAVMGALSVMGGDAVAQALQPVLDGVLLDVSSPLSLVVGLGTIALMLPAYLLASLAVNGRRLGLVTSVHGRMRWRWLWICVALSAATAVVVTAVSSLLPADGAPGTAPDPSVLWASLAVVLVLVPLQATAEEYVFRGYLMQAIGRWLRHPLFAIVLPVPLFVLGHLYDPMGQISVGLFAAAAGWLTWRTGGLEAAIAVHVINNLLAFGLGVFGFSDVTATEVGWPSFISSVLLIAVYCGAVELVLRRRPIEQTYRVPRKPMPAPIPMPTPTATVPRPGEPTPRITRL